MESILKILKKLMKLSKFFMKIAEIACRDLSQIFHVWFGGLELMMTFAYHTTCYLLCSDLVVCQH
jgi:hypothetical protein